MFDGQLHGPNRGNCGHPYLTLPWTSLTKSSNCCVAISVKNLVHDRGVRSKTPCASWVSSPSASSVPVRALAYVSVLVKESCNRLAGPSLPLDIGYSTTISPGIRNAVILRDRRCRWPGAATSPPPAKYTRSRTRPAAAPPASRNACCCAPSTTRSSFTGGAGRWCSTRTGGRPRGTRTGPRCCIAMDPQPDLGSPGPPGAFQTLW
jgi:hypothetical protein